VGALLLVGVARAAPSVEPVAAVAKSEDERLPKEVRKRAERAERESQQRDARELAFPEDSDLGRLLKGSSPSGAGAKIPRQVAPRTHGY